MKPIYKNTLAVTAGFVAGSAVNMGLITISGSIIPPPDGADVTTMEGLKESMHLFQPRHFILPFFVPVQFQKIVEEMLCINPVRILVIYMK